MRQSIKSIVNDKVLDFVNNFYYYHIDNIDNPKGQLNMKRHNAFLNPLGKEALITSGLSRSFESSLGNMLEKIAISVASETFTISDKTISGVVYPEQNEKIATYMDQYRNRVSYHLEPSGRHYTALRGQWNPQYAEPDRVNVDLHIIDEDNNHHLVELKAGGDLDTKKARAEKESLMRAFAILTNQLAEDNDGSSVRCYFATGYNKFGINADWKQHQVKTYFSNEELLIGKDFWNFITKSDRGYSSIMRAYQGNVDSINETLKNIKIAYMFHG